MDTAEALALGRMAAPFFEKAGLPRSAPQVSMCFGGGDDVRKREFFHLLADTHMHTRAHRI